MYAQLMIHCLSMPAITHYSFSYATQYDKSVPYDTPRPLEVSEMPGIIQSYIKAAQNAEKAGFDFIEIHSANGYLLDSFLQSCSNKRTDEYGGSFENRFRIVREVIEGILTVFPADRLGIRFSPNGAFQDMVSNKLKNKLTAYVLILHSLS
jgi:N-ethylmaleimide reductase